MKRRYDWIRDLPDHRDFMFLRLPTKISNVVDLRPKCSPIEDQLQLGACTGNAGVGIYECLEHIQGMKFDNKSRLFLYYNTRLIEHTVNTDSGGTIRDTFKALAKWGVCSEKIWPYDIQKFAVLPPKNCYADAIKHEIIVYQRLSVLDDLLNCLALGYPFEFGFSVYQSFESAKVAKTGIVPMPKKSEAFLGGHAVDGVGYEMDKKWIICRNSWGSKWGDYGYFYLPFDYISNPNLAADFWMAKKET